MANHFSLVVPLTFSLFLYCPHKPNRFGGVASVFPFIAHLFLPFVLS